MRYISFPTADALTTCEVRFVFSLYTPESFPNRRKESKKRKKEKKRKKKNKSRDLPASQLPPNKEAKASSLVILSAEAIISIFRLTFEDLPPTVSTAAAFLPPFLFASSPI